MGEGDEGAKEQKVMRGTKRTCRLVLAVHLCKVDFSVNKPLSMSDGCGLSQHSSAKPFSRKFRNSIPGWEPSQQKYGRIWACQSPLVNSIVKVTECLGNSSQEYEEGTLGCKVRTLIHFMTTQGQWKICAPGLWTAIKKNTGNQNWPSHTQNEEFFCRHPNSFVNAPLRTS